jgi:hypothetical protein
MSYRLYTAGGILAVTAPDPTFAIPDGYSRRPGPHHITLLDIADGKSIRASRGLSLRQYDAWLAEVVEAWDLGPFGSPVRLGIGRAQSGDHVAYYEVYDWHEAQSWRIQRIGLTRKDLHATICYLGGDVRDAPKDVSTLVAP